MRLTIPQSVIAIVADYAAAAETHASLDNLFIYAGCPGETPIGSKPAKALAWLRIVNKDASVSPLDVLGKLIEGYMETPILPGDYNEDSLTAFRLKVKDALGSSGLRYLSGGHIGSALAAPTKALETFIRGRDLKGIGEEFDRAAKKADTEPREAVSAAANILESICKHFIAERSLTLPSKQTLTELWAIVRKDLGFDPSQVADDDLRTVLTGLIQIVQGLGSFRTHASSAHGEGPRRYRLEPRHSRLAVHAAHTVALFVLESWDRKLQTKS